MANVLYRCLEKLPGDQPMVLVYEVRRGARGEYAGVLLRTRDELVGKAAARMRRGMTREELVADRVSGGAFSRGMAEDFVRAAEEDGRPLVEDGMKKADMALKALRDFGACALEKAAAGHKYVKKEPLPGGKGFRYVYAKGFGSKPEHAVGALRDGISHAKAHRNLIAGAGPQAQWAAHGYATAIHAGLRGAAQALANHAGKDHPTVRLLERHADEFDGYLGTTHKRGTQQQMLMHGSKLGALADEVRAAAAGAGKRGG